MAHVECNRARRDGGADLFCEEISVGTRALQYIMTMTTAFKIQGGSNMTGTDLCVNKPQCAAAV